MPYSAGNIEFVNSLFSFENEETTKAGLQINNFFQAPLDAVAQTMAPYAGQNLGAGKPERIKQGVKTAILCGLFLSLAMFVLAFAFARKAVVLFMDQPDTEVIEYAYRVIISMVGCYVFLILLNILRFV